MAKMSRDKGKRGEREFAALLTALGWPAERGVQYQGGVDSPDVRCPGLDEYVHFEVKRTEVLRLRAAVEQARKDISDTTMVAAVAHRRNNEGWMVTLSVEDFLRMAHFFVGNIQRRNEPLYPEGLKHG